MLWLLKKLSQRDVSFEHPKQMLQPEMPTIQIFAEPYWFSKLIYTLQFWMSKFRRIAILLPDKIKGVYSDLYTDYTWSTVVK